MATTPLTAAQILAALKAEGLTVHEHAGWRDHNREAATGKTFGPVNGVMIHHTAGASSLELCYNGRPDLGGPLCHTHLAKTGVAAMVGHGRANHAGTVAQNAYDAVVKESATHPRPDVAEPVDGNDHFYGLEIENLGDGKDPYPAAQYAAAVKWAAALCRAHGWSENSVIGHKEGTRRKVDPSFDMGKFRADVKAQLSKKAEVDLSNLVRAFETYPKNPAKDSTETVQEALHVEGLYSGAIDGKAGPLTKAGYAKWQRRCNYSGAAANGVPGKASLTKLGSKHGFAVVA